MSGQSFFLQKKSGGLSVTDRPFISDYSVFLGNFSDVDRLEAFRTLGDLEGYFVALVQGFEALRVDRRIMDEHIIAVFTCDEAKTLTLVEPFYSATIHTEYHLPS